MSSTNKTPNLELSQLVGNDVFTFMGDYNSDMAKIDEAVQTNKENIATNDQTVEALGVRVGNAEQSVAVAEEQVAEFGEQVTAMKVNLDDLHHEVAEDEKRIVTLEESTVELTERVEDLETKTDEIEGHLKAGDEEFYFDKKDGVFGYNTDEGRGADTFHPFNAGGQIGGGVDWSTVSLLTQTDRDFNGFGEISFNLLPYVTKVSVTNIVSPESSGSIKNCGIILKSGNTNLGGISNLNSVREIVIDREQYPEVTCTIHLDVYGIYGTRGIISGLKFE